MAAATFNPASTPFRIIIEPLNAEGEVLQRGKTVAKTQAEFDSKMDYAASQCPKYTAIKATMVDGQNVTHGFYTKAKGAKEWIYSEQFPGTPVVTPANPTAGVTRPKGDKKKKGASGTTTSTAKGKPGVIAAIVEILKGSVDNGGVTVKEIVSDLEKRFPSRAGESMEITVRCQLGRIPKQRNLKIDKQRMKDSKEFKYYIA